jgi:hypothetical protein
VHQFAFITVVCKLDVQKGFIVILGYHAMFYVKWLTNVYSLAFEKQVGNFMFWPRTTGVA